MNASRILASIARWAARRPLAVVLVAGVVTVAAGVLALRLEPSAGTETLVGKGSATFRATERYRERFGDDAVIVLVRGELTRLVLTQDIERLLGLEGCISGNAPRGVTPPGGKAGPCAAFAREKPVKVVYGPGTFINESVRQIAEQFQAQSRAKAAQAERAARAAREIAKAQGRSPAEQRQFAQQAKQLVYAEFTRDVLKLALRYGIRSVPRLNDPDFVSALVFDPARGAGVPKARFAYLFPNAGSALVQVRLRPELSDAQRKRAIGLVRAAVRMPQWRLRNGGAYTVTGAPVVVSDLTDSISSSILVLLFAALIVMAGTLALVFRSRPRLLPLGVAVAAAALTFGGMALAGVSLTMASIAVLPVLIGLAVDYAIQFQSRVDEARVGEGLPPAAAVGRAAALGAPTIATAALATGAGFLALLLSPVPMVRGFGVLLVIGIVLAFGCALTAGSAALALSGSAAGARLPRPLRAAGRALAAALRGAGELLAPAWRGARDLVRGLRPVRAAGQRVGATARASLEVAVRRPGRVLGVAVALAAAGWALDTQTKVVSDIQRLVPGDLPALRDLDTLQRTTGVGGEIDVTVEGRDLTEPAVVSWMTTYQRELVKRFGYSSKKGCGKAELCPAFSLPDLFRTGPPKDRNSIRALLDAVPPYFSQAVVTPDRRTATLAFGIRLMPLERQHAVIQEMRRRLDPPPGVSASLVGLPVLAAEANDRVSADWRRMVTLLAGLAAVALVLLAAFRRVERALVPLLPIALATGWSALVLFLLRVPLNPMSVTLGALVIAISTEFSVLLAERYRQERATGRAPAEALARTYRSTGAAVLASGVTAIAGFAVLMFSEIRMLRDFGFVTVVDLGVSLLGVMVVLPAVLVLAERGELAAAPARALRRVRRLRPRLRRAGAA